MTQEEKTIKAIEDWEKSQNIFIKDGRYYKELLEATRKSFEPEPEWPKDSDTVWGLYYDEVSKKHNLDSDRWVATKEDENNELVEELGVWPTKESAEAMRYMVQALEMGKLAQYEIDQEDCLGTVLRFDSELTKRFLKAHEERNKLRG